MLVKTFFFLPMRCFFLGLEILLFVVKAAHEKYLVREGTD